MIEEYLNNKVISLVKQMLFCEEEKKSLLLELVTMENTANNSRSDRDLADVCKNLKIIVENLVVTVRDNDKGETSESSVNIDVGNEKMDGQAKESTSKRKCRYFNRGYCKYGMNCRFYHSQVICKEYAAEGGCQTIGCSKRHPRQCRYWTENPEGCRRSDTCQYLHVKIESLSNNESDNTDILDEVGEDDESVSPCDKRDSYNDNKNVPQCHRRSMDPETEESYVVMRGNDGKARFVCKKCEATFTSQKSIKQHDMMKHVDPRFY